MKYCIAVQETLRREIVVEADSLEEAINHVESEYDKENIVLTADDAYDLAELLDCWVEFCAENGFQTNSVDYVERVCE